MFATVSDSGKFADPTMIVLGSSPDPSPPADRGSDPPPPHAASDTTATVARAILPTERRVKPDRIREVRMSVLPVVTGAGPADGSRWTRVRAIGWPV